MSSGQATVVEPFADVATAPPPAPPSPPTKAESVATAPSATIESLKTLINGCKDDPDGLQAKMSLVLSSGENLFDTLCWLHTLKAITINKAELLKIISWKKPGKTILPPMEDAGRSGMYVVSALEQCSNADEMANVVSTFLATHPQVETIETLRVSTACARRVG